MKIDAPRAWMTAQGDFGWLKDSIPSHSAYAPHAVRIVRESDWRKIMAVVKAADELVGDGTADWGDDEMNAVFGRTIQLRKHLEKRK